MNNPEILENKRLSPAIRYLLLSFYFIFIGFCAAGIWLKWDDINRTNNQYSSHIYEEGFDAVTVTVPLPRKVRKENFLDRLAQRTSPKPALVIQPERHQDTDQTWQKFAASRVIVPAGNVKVILVIDDLGIVKNTTQQMIDMDAPLTLSFLPYASDISSQVNDAYAKGHDILVHIPMEPKGKADPGPHALLSSTSPRVQMDSIHYNLGQFSNYIGINNHMGSLFTEDEVAVDRLLKVVKEKGLLVLDSKTTSGSLLEQMAAENNIPVTNRDIFLDNEQDINYIMGQLKALENVAKRQGTALAIGHPYPQTVAALKLWIPTLAAKGITIVPISQTIKDKYSNRLLASK
ncbi:MAG: divergent polysaccharide deacetylase family protein [Emcibacteraceae bacterium]|nr:divergent polysaccharide deacetylase family protein [Emcibacteraceae bacterium]